MLKVAILDDYQNVAQEFIDLKNLSSKFDIEIFSEPFENEDDTIEKLKEFEASNSFNFSIVSSSFSKGSLKISISNFDERFFKSINS